MHPGKALLLATAITLIALSPVRAMPDNEQKSIEAMGNLNGVALICKYASETKRLKLAMIENLPKVREYGALFDSQTNVAFLEFIEKKMRCPAAEDFSKQVDSGISELKLTFKK